MGAMNMNAQMNKFFGGRAWAVFAAASLGVAAAAMPAAAGAHADASSSTAATLETTTFRFDNIPVRSALQFLADEGNFNLVVSDSVTGTISLHLTDVTWEQALDVVLKLKGLEQRVEGRTRSVTAAGG